MTRVPTLNPPQANIDKNVSFFRENHAAYNKNVGELDTYAIIRAGVNEALAGIDRLLDIGSGGVFGYDTRLVSSIVALDLFFDDLPASLDGPANVSFKVGDALSIPEPDDSFDGVVMVMMIHHLIGKSVSESLANARRAIEEAVRVLKPGGRLIMMESCVPQWFYRFERAVFPLASLVIDSVLQHPATLQYPPSVVAAMMQGHVSSVETTRIRKGRWILQYGMKFPAALTPACPYRFVAHKNALA